MDEILDDQIDERLSNKMNAFYNKGMIELSGTIGDLGEITFKGNQQNQYFRTFNVEIELKDPRSVCLVAHGSYEQLKGFKEGQFICALAFIDCKRYGGRWYNNIRLWKIKKLITPD